MKCGFAQALDGEVRELGVNVTFLGQGGVKYNFDQTTGRNKKSHHK
jgi:hypothetical protein